jgi:GAF domain-containing protein
MKEGHSAELYGEAMQSISASFSADFSVIDLVHHVVEECRTVLGIADVGVVLADRKGQLHVVAATSERTSLVEALQIDTGKGPCMESYRTGRSAIVQDFYGREGAFARLAREQGFKSVYATPLRRHIYSIGALNLFASMPGAFTSDVRAIADAFARITAMAILVDRRSAGSVDRIDEALQARAHIERAKKLVMSDAQVDESGAFERMHSYAQKNLLPLISVARDVTSHRLTL